ncbi:MAG: EamA family transporter [Proteobacteria bacterium]|nr:EamA family transporter [Pseudomonadota bacterium]MBS0572052.1 EamA family transporter [Pseudomonadota bacterium]
MTASVFFLVLCAAALHAGWNAIVKGSGDKFAAAVGICLSAALIALAALPFVAAPARVSWPYISASMVLQTTYFSLVAAAYGRADMSLAYPVMRGGAPMIVALASGVLFGERLPAAGWLGVALISGGILSLALVGRHGSRTGLGLALLNTCVIATYTLTDAAGVRLSGAPIGYTLWVCIVTAPPVMALALWRRGPALIGQLARNWRDGLIGGFGTMTSYGVALWAMTLAPVAMVAALRETSILFATGISALVLGEKVGLPRVGAVLLIAAGAATLRLV